LPPDQLKILLQKAKSDLLNLQFYTQLLETEVVRWRNGTQVPKDEWARHTAAVAHLLADTNLDTLIPDEQPNAGLSSKEKDEFFARENELSDLLAEKELEIAEKDSRIEHLSKGLDQLRKGDQLIIDVGY
jgi:kinesin family protein 5